MYKDLIYDKFPECSDPCSFMKISTFLTTQFSESKPQIKFFYPKEVKITSEKLKKSLSSAGKNFVIFDSDRSPTSVSQSLTSVRFKWS